MSLNNENLNKSNNSQNNGSYKGIKDLPIQNNEKLNSEDENLKLKGHNETNTTPFGRSIEEIAEDSEKEKFKQLPDELKNKGWKLNKNILKIPVPKSECYLAIELINRIKKDIRIINEYDYWWIGKDLKEGFHKSYKKFFYEHHEPRNKFLMRFKPNDLELDESFLNDSEIVADLSEYNVENILVYNYQILKDHDEEEDDFEDIEERFKYPTFESYPEPVKKEVLEIHGKNLFLEHLMESVSWKHQGDIKTIKLELLAVGTAYISINKDKIDSVHTYLNAPKGKGKTDATNGVKEAQPDQYVVDLPSFSSKSLFYGKDKILSPICNLLFLDDTNLTPDTIELLKLVFDNERLTKVHMTVLDGKFVKLPLPRLFKGIVNRAKDDLDSELGDRCYINSLEDTKENNPLDVKNKIKEKNIVIIDNENLNFKLKACYQYLIDEIITNDIHFFNPMLLFFNVQEHDNRNINHYLALSKGMMFYNYPKRKKIGNVLIGSYEDIKNTLDIVSKDFKIQKDKLSNTERLIINFLKNDDENDIYTYKIIGNALSLNDDTIRKNIKGRDNQVGLEAKGYIKITAPEEEYQPSIITLIKEDYSNSESIPQTPETYISLLKKNPLLVKRSIIINFITSRHILINDNIEKKLEKFLEKDSHGLDSYNSLCDMLEEFNSIIEKDNNVIYRNSDSHIKYEEDTHSKNVVKNINEEIFSFISDFERSLSEDAKHKEKPEKTKQKKNITQPNKSLHSLKDKNSNKDSRSHIHKNIYEILNQHGNLTIDGLNKFCDRLDDDLSESMRIMARELKFLEENLYLNHDNKTKKYHIKTEFTDYYKDKLEGLKDED